jgi:hypothetical protein
MRRLRATAPRLRVFRRFDSVRETVRHYDHFTNASRGLSRFWRVSHLLVEQRYGTWVAKAESETADGRQERAGDQTMIDPRRSAARVLKPRLVGVGHVVPISRGRDLAEQAVGLIVGASGEIERVTVGVQESAEHQRPQAVDRDRPVLLVAQFVLEPAAVVERVDPPGKLAGIAEIADQDVAAEPAEAGGRASDAPGRVEDAAGSEAPQQLAVGAEYVDEAVARASDDVVLVGILPCVGHEQVAIDIGDAERREARGYPWIGKGVVERRQLEIDVIGFDGAGAEVGGKQEVAVDVGAEWIASFDRPE